jgi:hypothetical protein
MKEPNKTKFMNRMFETANRFKDYFHNVDSLASFESSSCMPFIPLFSECIGFIFYCSLIGCNN